MSEIDKFYEILEILMIEKRFDLHEFLVGVMELLDPDYMVESSESDIEVEDGSGCEDEDLEFNIDNNGFYSIH